jgi:hypothetical protein
MMMMNQVGEKIKLCIVGNNKNFLATLNTEPCNGTSDLYYSNSKYMKSVCVMRPAMNFNDAFRSCLGLRMDLFNGTENDSQVALYEYGQQFDP